MTEAERPITRRSLGRRAVQVGAATVVAPSFMNVVSGDTASGNVELETTATVPTNTTLEITVYEDTDGDGTANTQETRTISDGTTTNEYGTLTSTTSESNTLWLQLSLSTTDNTVTPELDSATIKLPASSSVETQTATPGGGVGDTNPLGITELWNDPKVMGAFTVLSYAAIGLWSRSLTLAAWAGYIAFIALAFKTGIELFVNIALLTLVIVFLLGMFKLVNIEFESD